MLRSNARLAFMVLVLMSSFSWNRLIVSHNTTRLEHPDMDYLQTLSTNAIDILYAFAKAQPHKVSEHNYIESDYKEWRLTQGEKNWQEMTLQNIIKN